MTCTKLRGAFSFLMENIDSKASTADNLCWKCWSFPGEPIAISTVIFVSSLSLNLLIYLWKSVNQNSNVNWSSSAILVKSNFSLSFCVIA